MYVILENVMSEQELDQNQVIHQVQNLFYDSINCGDIKQVKILLASENDINIKFFTANNNYKLIFALDLAIIKGNLEIVELLFEHGAQITNRNYQLYYLHKTAYSLNMINAPIIAKILIDHGVKIDAVTNEYMTALHYSSYSLHTALTKLLLEQGANPNAIACYKKSPLHIAVSAGEVGSVKLLLDYGANPKFLHMNGKSSLDLAIERGNSQIIALLNQAIENSTYNNIKFIENNIDESNYELCPPYHEDGWIVPVGRSAVLIPGLDYDVFEIIGTAPQEQVFSDSNTICVGCADFSNYDFTKLINYLDN